jgi:hypothetical protein
MGVLSSLIHAINCPPGAIFTPFEEKFPSVNLQFCNIPDIDVWKAKLFCPPVQFLRIASPIFPTEAKLLVPPTQFSKVPPSISPRVAKLESPLIQSTNIPSQ